MKLRWKEFTVAFLMAVVLWYGVSGSEKIESQVEVRMDYRGLPQGLVVRSGLVNKVSVRVRASAGMLRTLANRDYAFYLDLSDVHKGENVLAVNMAYLPFRSGVEVIEVTPSRIFLDVDTVGTKVLPLEAQIMVELPEDYVAHVSFNPPEVTVTGPATVLDDLTGIAVQIPVENPDQIGETTFTRLLPLPDGVDASPPEVKATLSVGIKRKLVKVTRTVQVTAPPDMGKFIRPDKVNIDVAMPESLVSKAAANKDIRAFVQLTRHDLGSYTLPVQVELPDGAELIAVDPPRVTVTLEQK
ncbi:MAG: CdaR family protein [Desulfovibrionaceae bacterium]|nr:CdaR family protein [Desulfovibrionaceae bacterium]